MKNLKYLSLIVFSLVLLNTSCSKDENVVPDQTLAQQYPELSNLTWYSTDGNTDLSVLPQVTSITISDNILTFKFKDENGSYTFKYDQIEISGIDYLLSSTGNYRDLLLRNVKFNNNKTKVEFDWKNVNISNHYVLKEL